MLQLCGHLSYNCRLPKTYGGWGGTHGCRCGACGDHGGGHAGVMAEGCDGPQANAATIEETTTLTLIGKHIKQWEQWQKSKVSKIPNTTPAQHVIVTTSHSSNFANYAHFGKGPQEEAPAPTCRHNIECVIDSGASKYATCISSFLKNTYSACLL